jgi:hypothetical protein
MTSLNVPERMSELSDGVIRPFNATTEGRHGSISRIPVWAKSGKLLVRREENS